MAYISRTQLLEYTTRSSYVAEARLHKSTSRASAQTTVFLSHSHKDKDLVAPTLGFLANQGVLVYVDWLDQGMPDNTSSQTAARIKQMIQLNDKFLLLASEQSITSRWVPWELGIADGAKDLDNMAVLAVQEPSRPFPGNEYLDLYPKVHSLTSGKWGVVPAGSDSGIPLESWLRK